MNKKLTMILAFLVVVLLFGVYLFINKNKSDELIISNETESLEIIDESEEIVATYSVLVDTEVKISFVVTLVLMLTPTPTLTNITLFYGDGCPHCEIVEEFIKKNNLKDKISFVQKEVYNDKKNSDDLVAKAKICGIPTNSIGVPFLWDGTKCLVGGKDIIDLFKSLIN